MVRFQNVKKLAFIVLFKVGILFWCLIALFDDLNIIVTSILILVFILILNILWRQCFLLLSDKLLFELYSKLTEYGMLKIPFLSFQSISLMFFRWTFVGGAIWITGYHILSWMHVYPVRNFCSFSLQIYIVLYLIQPFDELVYV